MLKMPGLERLDAQMNAAGALRRHFYWKTGATRFRVIYLKDVGNSFGPMPAALQTATGEVHPASVVTYVHEESNRSFNILVSADFRILPYFGDDYGDLLDILSQGGHGGKLMPREFFAALDASIPAFSLTHPVRPDDLRPPSRILGTDGRYFWKLDPPTHGQTTAQNLLKTRMLLGDKIADYCISHGLSSWWRHKKPSQHWTTEEIAEMYHD